MLECNSRGQCWVFLCREQETWREMAGDREGCRGQRGLRHPTVVPDKDAFLRARRSAQKMPFFLGKGTQSKRHW